ncbi:MAG TPA: hypothetical protein VM368_09160 [Flavisolibacter sp.]|nr:hypothetical protein [Flavisolibacter sp.]
MGIETVNNRREIFIFYSIVLMLICLFISRAALSVSMMIFFGLTLIHKNFVHQLSSFLKDKFLLITSLLFFIPFISGLWSDDLHSWLNITKTKLPFFLFPLSFAGNWQLTIEEWKKVGCTFIAVILIGCLWSLGHYIFNATSIHQGYLQAKTLPTPLGNDHVRFSWIVAIAAIASVILIDLSKQQISKIILISIVIFFCVYLHILAARTGILSLYIFFFLYATHLIISRKHLKSSSVILCVVILLPLFAWFLMPTFQNRIKYFVYDFSFIENQVYVPGSNDGVRALSIQAGWAVLKKNPFGVGAGDVKRTTEIWYEQHVPNMIASDKFLPLNEWLMYGGFTGWIGVVLFTIVMIYPFFLKMKYKIFWIAFNLIAALSFVFDIGLEVQYGVFLYSFILLWWRKWFQEAPDYAR